MQSLLTAAKLFFILFVLTGLIYPFAVLLVANTAFPHQTHGSLILNESGTIIGSSLIGENFTLPRYFQGRPSATPYSQDNASNSGGSNLGPTNPLLLEQVTSRVKSLRSYGISGPIPSDIVMTSASGLDPHISLEAALLQVPIIARERKINESRIQDLVMKETEWNPIPFGQPYVNVLSLNQALDRSLGEGT
ncbi:MAG: potassium-transporting ATPase subunit KdpC [Methanomicrobiales archaeon]|nr:potassium-transporting ATPase subunit KdpC [Methanomicrobiales archaeon]